MVFDVVIDGIRVVVDLLFQDVDRERPGVFDVRINLARSESAECDLRPTEVELTFDIEVGPVFNQVGHHVPENQLLGKVLRPDDNRIVVSSEGINRSCE